MRLFSSGRKWAMRVLILAAVLGVMRPQPAAAGGYVMDLITELESTDSAVGDVLRWLEQHSEWIDTHMYRIKNFLDTRLESLKTKVMNMGNKAYDQDVQMHIKMGEKAADHTSGAVQSDMSTACAKAVMHSNARQMASLNQVTYMGLMTTFSSQGYTSTASTAATRVPDHIVRFCTLVGPPGGDGTPSYNFTTFSSTNAGKMWKK